MLDWLGDEARPCPRRRGQRSGSSGPSSAAFAGRYPSRANSVAPDGTAAVGKAVLAALLTRPARAPVSY